MTTELAVLEPQELSADLSLEELGQVVRREHEAATRKGREAVEHAIRVGEALLAVKKKLGTEQTWTSWRTEHFPTSMYQIYMRLAAYQGHLREQEPTTLPAALRLLRGLPPFDVAEGERGRFHSPEMATEAQELRDRGLLQREIGEVLGVSQNTVSRLLNPDLRQKHNRQNAKARRRARLAREALRQQERDRAARRLGGSVAKCYSMILKTAEAAEQARVDSENPEVKSAMSAAQAKLYSARDEIVRALGVE